MCVYRKGKCKQVEQGQECWLGMRLRQYHMLCGALLRVWKRVADVVSDITNSSILQIVRLKTKQNSKQVGKWNVLHTPVEDTHYTHGHVRCNAIKSLQRLISLSVIRCYTVVTCNFFMLILF